MRSGHNASASREDMTMKAGLLWLLGVPLPVVLLLAFCTDIV
jgi:hypothetical protein